MDFHDLRFFPLVFWALGLIFISCIDDHWRKIDGREKEDGEAGAKLWFWGCVFFWSIGMIT